MVGFRSSAWAATAVLVLACAACGGGEPESVTPTPSLDVDFDGIAVQSSGLEVGPARVQVTTSGDARLWRVELECLTPDGCAGQLRATIHFTGTRGAEIARVTGPVDAAQGEMMSVQGVRRPPEPVTSVERVELDFTAGVVPQAAPSPRFIRRPTPVRPTPYD